MKREFNGKIFEISDITENEHCLCNAFVQEDHTITNEKGEPTISVEMADLECFRGHKITINGITLKSTDDKDLSNNVYNWCISDEEENILLEGTGILSISSFLKALLTKSEYDLLISNAEWDASEYHEKLKKDAWLKYNEIKGN